MTTHHETHGKAHAHKAKTEEEVREVAEAWLPALEALAADEAMPIPARNAAEALAGLARAIGESSGKEK